MRTGQTSPAFQFYASDTMADQRYRLMSLDERGMYLSLLCECWVNKTAPANPDDLGKWLGYAPAVIKAALTERVLSFFTSNGGVLVSPELEKYRQEKIEARAKMSRAGKEGARVKEEMKRAALLQQQSHPPSHPEGYPQGSRVEMSRDEMNRGESLRKDDFSACDPWVKDYDDAQFGRV